MPPPPAVDPKPPTPAGSKRRSAFVSRLLSTLVLWAVVAGAFAVGSQTLFFALVVAILFAGLFEYFQLIKSATGSRRFFGQTLVVSAVYLWYLFGLRQGASPTQLGAADGLAVAGLLLALVVSRLGSGLEGRKSLDELMRALFAFAYITLLFGFAVKILCLPLVDRAGNPSSAWYVLFLIAVTKLTDTGAYAVGSLVGRHKCIPHISPGKTWEGFAGGFLFAFIGAFACRYLLADRLELLAPTSTLVGVTLCIAVAAIVGDLAESILKRSLAIKDSGQLMPGIGGVLDLIDSVLFAAPVFYFYLLVLG